MANVATPYGLRLTKRLGQTNQRHGFNQYPIASAYGTDLKCGDLVKLAVGGTVEKDTGTTTALPVGVFMGVAYTDASMGFLNRAQWKAGTIASDAMAYVIDDPDALFQIQADGSLSRNAIGTNAAIVQGAGSLNLGRSGVALDASTIANTATLPLRIMEFVNIPGFSTPGDAYTDVIVRINTHFNRSATGNAAT